MKILKSRSAVIRERISKWEQEKTRLKFHLHLSRFHGQYLSSESIEEASHYVSCIERMINRLYKKLNKKR